MSNRHGDRNFWMLMGLWWLFAAEEEEEEERRAAREDRDCDDEDGEDE